MFKKKLQRVHFQIGVCIAVGLMGFVAEPVRAEQTVISVGLPDCSAWGPYSRFPLSSFDQPQWNGGDFRHFISPNRYDSNWVHRHLSQAQYEEVWPFFQRFLLWRLEFLVRNSSVHARYFLAQERRHLVPALAEFLRRQRAWEQRSGISRRAQDLPSPLLGHHRTGIRLGAVYFDAFFPSLEQLRTEMGQNLYSGFDDQVYLRTRHLVEKGVFRQLEYRPDFQRRQVSLTDSLTVGSFRMYSCGFSRRTRLGVRRYLLVAPTFNDPAHDVIRLLGRASTPRSGAVVGEIVLGHGVIQARERIPNDEWNVITQDPRRQGWPLRRWRGRSGSSTALTSIPSGVFTLYLESRDPGQSVWSVMDQYTSGFNIGERTRLTVRDTYAGAKEFRLRFAFNPRAANGRFQTDRPLVQLHIDELKLEMDHCVPNQAGEGCL